MYLGRVVEQGTAVDVIERPQHPYTQALVDAIPVPTAGGGGRRELLGGELPDADRRADRLPLPSALPEALRALRQRRPAAARRRRPRPAGRLPAARPDARRPADAAWLSAGATSPARSGGSSPGARNAITDVPGVRVGHAQAASGERTGVTVVAPPVAAGRWPAPRPSTASAS